MENDTGVRKCKECGMEPRTANEERILEHNEQVCIVCETKETCKYPKKCEGCYNDTYPTNTFKTEKGKWLCNECYERDISDKKMEELGVPKYCEWYKQSGIKAKDNMVCRGILTITSYHELGGLHLCERHAQLSQRNRNM